MRITFALTAPVLISNIQRCHGFLWLVFLFCFSISSVFAETTATVNKAASDDIVGDWMVNTGDGVVRIYRHHGEYRGRVVWAGRESLDWWQGQQSVAIPWQNRAATKALKHAPMLGVEILQGLRFDAQETWQGGRIFNVLNGKTYLCELSLEQADVLKLRGYVGLKIFGASVLWHRLTAAQKAEMPSFPNRFEFPDSWP